MSDWGYYYDTTWKCFTITWCGWFYAHFYSKKKMERYLKMIRSVCEPPKEGE